MELAKNTLNHLITYLKAHGYPDECFAVEYQIKNYRADLAIIDNNLNVPIMIFEIKNIKNSQTIEMGKKQLKRITNEYPTVPQYLVFPTNFEPYFEIENIDSENNANNYDSLNYSYQRNSRKEELIVSKDNEKKVVFNWFKLLCLSLATVSIGVGLINQFTSYKFDKISLIIFLFSTGLIILPFASKLKLLGVEFERLKDDK